MSAPPQRSAGLSRLSTVLLLSLALFVASSLRWRFLDVPLERDEGEYAYFGQVILHGGLPYRDAYNMKPPGIYYAHAAVLALCGETARCVRLAVVLAALASACLFYRSARHWLAREPALAATAAFALLAANHRLLGFAAKAEQYVLAFGLAGLALGFSALHRSGTVRWWWAGLASGLASTMKPTGAFFAAYLAWRCVHAILRRNTACGFRSLGALGAGFALPWAVVFAGFFQAGAFERLWFWTVTYARTYATGVPFNDGLRLAQATAAYVFAGAPLLWLLAACGWLLRATRAATSRKDGLGSFFVVSALAVAAGWRFSEHYFLLLVPAAAVGVGLVAEAPVRWPLVARTVIGIVLAASAVQEWRTFRGLSPTEVSRAIYERNPFPEAVLIAERIRAATAPEERIAVIGSEPEIYFYAHRRAATGFVYTYPLMEAHPFALSMQEQMIREIEAAAPRFLILVHVPSSWSRGPGSFTRILDWSAAYANSKYRPYGLVEIPGQGIGRSVWGENARISHPTSDWFIAVFERNP